MSDKYLWGSGPIAGGGGWKGWCESEKALSCGEEEILFCRIRDGVVMTWASHRMLPPSQRAFAAGLALAGPGQHVAVPEADEAWNDVLSIQEELA